MPTTLHQETAFVLSRRMCWWTDRTLADNLRWRWWHWAHFVWNTQVAWRMTYLFKPNPLAHLGFGSPFDIDQSKWWWKVNSYCCRRIDFYRGNRHAPPI